MNEATKQPIFYLREFINFATPKVCVHDSPQCVCRRARIALAHIESLETPSDGVELREASAALWRDLRPQGDFSVRDVLKVCQFARAQSVDHLKEIERLKGARSRGATIKFALQNRGDDSVGVDGWYEEITITRSRAKEFDSEEIELLRNALVECLGDDCSCRTEAEQKMEAENDFGRFEELAAPPPPKVLEPQLGLCIYSHVPHAQDTTHVGASGLNLICRNWRPIPSAQEIAIPTQKEDYESNVCAEHGVYHCADCYPTTAQSQVSEPETSKCRLCVSGDVPEWSEDAKCYIHRSPTLDRRCDSQFSWNHKNNSAATPSSPSEAPTTKGGDAA